MRIDSHQHLWNLEVTPQDWIAGEELAPINRSFLSDELVVAAGAHVDRTVLVQTVTEAAETPVMLDYAAATDLIGGVVGWVDLTAPTVADQVDRALSHANGSYLVGIRHQVQGEPDPAWLVRDDVLAGLRAVGDAGLVYDLLTIPAQLPAATQAVGQLESMSFCVNHVSKPPIASGQIDEWRADIIKLAEHQNVTCKVSGMVTEADWASWTIDDLRPYFEVVLAAFGPDRLMFGSDWPVCLLAAEYDQVVATFDELIGELSRDEQSAIWGGTAARVYGLEA